MTRERDRYGRASIAERIGGLWEAFRANRTAQVVVAVALGVVLALRLVSPQVMRIPDLRVGDCVYIRAGTPDVDPTGRQVGDEGAVRASLRAEGAELAACDLSHSHEVSALFTVDDPTGAPYPGEAALLERELGRCLEIFGPFVGRALEGSIYDTTVVVPGADGWSGGDRHGVCLIVLRNGRFMDGQARGSGT